MIRRVTLVRRKMGLTADEFFAHWLGRHAELVSQLPGLRGWRFIRIDRCIPESAAWDGLGETWFDSIADFDRAFATEPLRTALLEDRDMFIAEAHSCFVPEPAGFAPPDGAVR
jgi:uncharacterized protein (TIGR02118 family)